jgi:gentisate 1,2-dioxygenase
MIQGTGAYTTVEGERVTMVPGDLILTPNWQWHDHGNTSTEPIVWMDGLDRLLVQNLNAGFFDPYPQGSQPVTKPIDYSTKRFGSTSLRPVWEQVPTSRAPSPQIAYRWQETATTLRALAELGETGPFGEIGVTYVNPRTGGHVLNTIGCNAFYLAAGTRTRARRHTGSSVFHVISGSGRSVVEGQTLAWEKGDFFVVPPWAVYEHAAVETEAFLFCMNDWPVMEALGLMREEN